MIRRAITLLTILLVPPAAAALPLPAGQPLTADLATPLVEAELPPLAPDRRWSIAISSPRLPLPNPASGDAEMALEGWQHEPRSGRFSALLRVTLPTGESGRLSLQGRAEEQVEVAVLARTVGKGERIGAADVVRTWLASARLQDDALVEVEALVDREAGRRLSAGKVVRTADVRAPRLVRKGEPVTLVYRSAALQLTAEGTSLGDAAEGEPVPVLNQAGKRAVRGVVVGPRLVEVGPGKGALP